MFPEVNSLIKMPGKAFMGKRGIQFVFCAGAAVVDIDHIFGGIVKGCSKIKRRT